MTHSRLIIAAVLGATMLSPAAAQAPARTPPTQIITLWSFDYAPKPIHLRAGAPVTLAFVNRADSGHDFTAREFFANSRMIAGAAPDGKIQLRGGKARSVTLVPRAGHYAVHCSHMFHKQLGMRDLIVVD